MPDTSPDPIATFNQSLTSGAAELAIDLTPTHLDLFTRHYTFLLAHRAHGITTITDPVHAAIKHFLDSLTALLIRDIRPGELVADIGSGGGFPGLPLAVLRPAASFTLVESNLRRAAHLQQLISDLGLPNVSVLSHRAEDLARDPAPPPHRLIASSPLRPFRESFDLVIARALAPMPVLLEYCLPLVRVGGDCLALKGPGGEAELRRSQRALDLLGGRVAATLPLMLPQSMGERLLILIRKHSPTPPRYPRRPGAPAKRPL